MSTPCRIGIVNADGSVNSIYCHYDGGIDYTGKMLLTYYNDEVAARALIRFGDLRALGTFVGATIQHVAMEPAKKPVTSKSVVEFDKLREEYNYLFRDGKWFVAARNSYHPLDELTW